MKRLKRCWCWVLLAFLASPLLAQDPDADRPTLRLPPALPDGRPLRPIALFSSQMDELIPDDYRPISMDQLSEAITRLTDRATDDKASRLKSGLLGRGNRRHTCQRSQCDRYRVRPSD